MRSHYARYVLPLGAHDGLSWYGDNLDIVLLLRAIHRPRRQRHIVRHRREGRRTREQKPSYKFQRGGKSTDASKWERAMGSKPKNFNKLNTARFIGLKRS